MFQDAYVTAARFTNPVVVSQRTVGGKCSSGIGSFIVVNDEGWIITAAHILREIMEMERQGLLIQNFNTLMEAVNKDENLSRKEKQRRINALGRPTRDTTRNFSAWWGRDHWQLDEAHFNPVVDIGIGRLKNFNKNEVSKYPVFKDPTKNFTPGIGLCRLGFPFFSINPTFDESTGFFHLPPGALPMPLFPSEGILARIANVRVPDGLPPPPYPQRLIETSSPGLRGQSGGPIFDAKGTVWGVQTHTVSYPLGFDPKSPSSSSGATVHQFLNVGRGAHPDSIFGLFNQFGVRYEISDY